MRALRWITVAALIVCACALGLAAVKAAPAPPPHAQMTEEHPWPEVDWDALISANPDVAGYLSIPNTNVAGPVVASPEGDGAFYLNHDWTGAPSVSGAIALDAEAEGDVLCQREARVSAIYAHNMNDGSMFADVAGYSSSGFAEGHRCAYLQTPGAAATLDFLFSEVIEGGTAAKRCAFDSAEEYRAWASERRAGAAVDTGRDLPDAMVCLCTCSYTRYANERTLAYFEIKEVVYG